MVLNVELDKVNIQAFIRQARMLQDETISFNREEIRAFGIKEQCHGIARKYLGEDIRFLGDAQGIRFYLMERFGNKALRFFEDAFFNIVLDIEHAILFYHWINRYQKEFLPTAKGLLFYIAGVQLHDEFEQLIKVAPRGKITPAFALDSKLFDWKRCPQIINKYMLHLSVPEGYEAYVYEREYLGHIAFLMSHGKSFEEAKEMMHQTTSGLFYSFLPKHVESQLLPSILTNGFETSYMDGIATQAYIKDRGTLENEHSLDEMYNVYNYNVKPRMVDIMGAIINNVSEEMAQISDLRSRDAFIYHLSPTRIGLLVHERKSINNVLPTLGKYFKPIGDLDLEQIIDGEFC